MLMDTYLYGTFDAMKPGRNGPTSTSSTRSVRATSIQFFEQAFEWENMTYLFYPVLLGPPQRVDQQAPTIQDPDPLFAQFRQAGSARIVLPVHPRLQRPGDVLP